MREVTLYYAILTALAAGHTNVHAIAKQAGQDPRALLLPATAPGAGLRRAALSVTGDAPSARSVHYNLTDPLLRFWFRFVFPSTSYIRHMGADGL